MADPVVEPLLLTPTQAANSLAISRSKTFQLLKTGELPSLKIGKSRRIPAATLEHWVQRQVTGARRRV